MDIILKVSMLVEEECRKESNPYGYFSAWRHINHVVELSRIFTKEVEADREITELAAWLHDWSSIQGFSEGHHERGASAAEEILKDLNYAFEKIAAVQYCVFSHRSSQNIPRRTKEAECVGNADAVAHFLEIPDLLCSTYFRKKNMTVEEVVRWLREKLERDYKKITIPGAIDMVTPYHEAAMIILET